MSRTNLIFVMGPTCAGKSTLLQLVKGEDPDRVGLVEVGKMLRAKYPPDYFKGQNNPKHTANEAWALCEREIQRYVESGKDVILVDGQPRDVPQVGLCLYSFPTSEFETRFLLVDASLDERERRARENRSGDDLETLAIPRLTNDMIAYYPVLVELIKAGRRIEIFDSTNPDRVSFDELFTPIIDSILSVRP